MRISNDFLFIRDLIMKAFINIPAPTECPYTGMYTYT